MLLASVAFAGALVQPPDVTRARLVTYDAHGATVEALVAAMDEESPYRDPSGHSWHAGTKYKVSWSWREVGGGRCAVDPLKARVSVVLPTIRTREALKGKVRRYLTALATHEQGHVDRAREEIRALRRELDGMKPAPCQRLGAAVEAAGQAALDRLEHKMVAYDERTGHGATQGARLE